MTASTPETSLRQQFWHSVKRGTGEAVLILKKNPRLDFSSLIIKAAKANLSYDPQSEGSRAWYVFELIKLAPQKKKIRTAILKNLATEKDDTWDLQQLFDLAAYFARQGDAEAREAIYKRYRGKKIRFSDWLGERAIIELDGIEGLKFIAVRRGKAGLKNPDIYGDRELISQFKELHPGLRVMRELQKAAKTNKWIQAYIESANQPKTPKIKSPRYNYDMVNQKIEELKVVPLGPAHAKKLSKRVLTRLADDFLKETNRLKQEKYLRIFQYVPFPYHYQSILKLAKAPQRKNDRLVEFACASLQFFTSDEIRTYTLQKLQKTRHPEDYLSLLVANYRDGDAKLLSTIAKKSKDPDRAHDLAYSYIPIYEKNKTKECLEPLMAIYDSMTCGIHRKGLISIMWENKVLPKKILKEIEFDSFDSTRELFFEASAGKQ